MSAADRALLKLAAKAAGIAVVRTRLHDPACQDFLIRGSVRNPSQDLGPWNPLTNDGDALRLAVKLRLTVSWDRFDDDDYATATPPHTHQGYDCMVDQDPHAATRRAIVRAAAEIGRAMP